MSGKETGKRRVLSTSLKVDSVVVRMSILVVDRLCRHRKRARSK